MPTDKIDATYRATTIATYAGWPLAVHEPVNEHDLKTLARYLAAELSLATGCATPAKDGPGSGRFSPMPADKWRVTVCKPRRGRDRGEWVLRVRGPGQAHGKREQTGVAWSEETRPQAEAVASRRLRELSGEGLPLTVGEVYDRWLAAAPAKPTTHATHMTARGRLVRLALWHAEDGSLSPGDVARARRACTRELALKVSTARGSLGHARRAWLWARVEGLVSQDWPSLPAWKAPKHERCRKRAFSHEELADLVEFAAGYGRGRYSLLLEVLIRTACRVGEACSLRREDVSVLGDRALLMIRETKTHVARTALVPPWLGEALLSSAGEEWLFPASTRPGPMNQSSLSNMTRQWVLARGLDGELDVHSIRRWGVGVLHRAEVPIAVAQLVTGHEDPQVFLGYAQRAEYEVLGAAEVLWGAGPMSPWDPKWTPLGPRDPDSESSGLSGEDLEAG